MAQSTDPNLSFTPTAADIYTVSLVTFTDGIQSASNTVAITVNAVAPTIDTIPDATVAVGQTFNLSAVFTDPNLNDTHTVTVDWNDGSPLDTAVLVTEPSSDGITTTSGAVNDSHVYATATTGTPNTVTVTLTNSEGASTQKTFAVTVVVSTATVSLTSFSANSDGSQLQVPYSVTGMAAPFTIGIYSSADGTMPDQLLTSIKVDGTNFALTGTDTAMVTPSFDDIPANYHLIAVTNGNSDITQSTVEFSGGIFIATSESANPPQKILNVIGGTSGDTMTIHGPGAGSGLANTVVLNSNSPFTIDSSITGIHVRGESGTDDIEVDSDVTLPLWLFGGSGTTTINDAGSGADILAAGDGATTIAHAGSGNAIISGGTGSTTITTESGNDTIYSGLGSTTITTGTGNVTINGGAGVATITTGPGNDTISFGTGRTVLHEGNGQVSPEVLDDSDGARTGITNTYTESGSGWSSPGAGVGFNQGQRVNDGSDSSAKAIWTFGNLDPTAYYNVYVTWSADAGASTGAVYSVSQDGGTTWQTLTGVNQTQAAADFQAAGTYWHDLGVFPATSGSLKVRLSASTGEVLADAAMIIPHSAPLVTNLTMGTFTVDSQGNLSVTYTINGEDSQPFSIGVYGSPDGVQLARLLQTYSVDDPTLLTGGGTTHIVTFPASLFRIDSSQYVIAQLDPGDAVQETSKADNISATLSGIFEEADGTLVVLGNATSLTNDGISLTQDLISGNVTVNTTDNNGNPLGSNTFAGVRSVIVSTPAGNNTLRIDPSVTMPVSAYVGPSSNLLGTASVITNDMAPQLMVASVVPVAWESGGQNGEYLVTRVGNTANALIVSYSVSGTAIGGVDYQALSGIVIIPAGAVSALISVMPIDGGLVGTSATVVITLASGNGYKVSSYSSATVTISQNGTASGSGPVSASMTFFAPDGTPEATDDTALVGDTIPMGIALTSGDTSGMSFTISYDSSLVTVTENGSVVPSGSTISLGTADTIFGVTAANPSNNTPVEDEIEVDEWFTAETGTLCTIEANLGVLHMNMTEAVAAKDIDVTTPTVKVGQKIVLEVVRQAADGTRTNVNSNITWSLPGSDPVTVTPITPLGTSLGNYVKSFDPSLQKNQVANFIPSDYKKSDFTFYWVDAGGSKVHAEILDPQNHDGDGTVDGKFTVLRPTVKVTAKPLANSPGNTLGFNLERPTPTDVERAITFGDPASGLQGNAWRVDGYPAGWQYGFAQTLSDKVSYTIPAALGFTDPNTQKPIQGRFGILPNGEADGLDSAFPYDKDPTTNSSGWFTAAHPMATTAANGALPEGDSPSVVIFKGGQASLNISFTVWYGCQPIDGSGNPIGIWVPLASLNWSVTIKAVWDVANVEPTILISSVTIGTASSPFGGAGQVLQYSGNQGGATTPTVFDFVSTTQFPEWSHIVNEPGSNQFGPLP